jgi:hypothetical protein
MDRSLNADDLRLLASLGAPPAQSPAEVVWAPSLADLPQWFAQAVIEQAAWLGLELRGAGGRYEIARADAA